jgi:hypothetical protein
MEGRGKRLLASVSVLAVSAGLLAGPTSATPDDASAAEQEHSGAPLRSGDPVVELALRLSGQRTAAAVSGELRAMLTPLTPERIEQLPALVRDLRSLGLGSRVQDAAEATLVELLADADPPLGDEQLDELAAAFAGVPEPLRLTITPPDDLDVGRVSDQSRDRARARVIGLYSG